MKLNKRVGIRSGTCRKSGIISQCISLSVKRIAYHIIPVSLILHTNIQSVRSVYWVRIRFIYIKLTLCAYIYIHNQYLQVKTYNCLHRSHISNSFIQISTEEIFSCIYCSFEKNKFQQSIKYLKNRISIFTL